MHSLTYTFIMPESRERNNEIPSSPIEQKIRIIDRGQDNIGPIPREIKSWMQKVEEDVAVTDPTLILNDNQQPLIQSSAPSNPKITLPSTRQSFLSGFRKTFSDAGFWLSTFIFRLIKIKKGAVIFKSDDIN